MRIFVGSFLILMLSISVFSQEKRRVALGIFVDNTGSLRTQIDKEIEAANEVLKQAKDDNYVFLFGFATGVSSNSQMAEAAVGVKCSNDHDLVKRQLDGIFTVPGQTKLLDAIKTSAEYFSINKPDKCETFSEQKLVLITDGEDRASTIKEKDLISFLKTQPVKVYAIGLIDELSEDGGFMGKAPKEKSRDFLKTLAKETGGKVVFPKKKQSMQDVIKELFEPAVSK